MNSPAWSRCTSAALPPIVPESSTGDEPAPGHGSNRFLGGAEAVPMPFQTMRHDLNSRAAEVSGPAKTRVGA